MRNRKFVVSLLLILIMIGVCGCKKIDNNKSMLRKESDAEYIEMMKNYMEEKYGNSFEVVEHFLPEDASYSGMELNVLVLRDSNGRTTDVRARVGTPYNYFDYYIESCTAAKILSEMNIFYECIEKIQFYVTIFNDSLNEIDTTPGNIDTFTAVIKVPEEPNDINMKDLFELYQDICSLGYKNIRFLVGFVGESEGFDEAIENYRVHAKADWHDYSGDFYAFLCVRSEELSFDEFKNCIER